MYFRTDSFEADSEPALDLKMKTKVEPALKIEAEAKVEDEHEAD